MSGRWSVRVFDTNGAPKRDIETWVSLSALPRVSAAGWWELVVDASDPDLVADLLPVTAENGTAERVSIIEDGVVRVSGLIDDYQHSTEGARRVLRLFGPDDTAVLGDRVIYPDPAKTPPNWAREYDTKQAAGSTAITHFVRRNLGPDALPGRRWAGFTLAADPQVGATLRWNGRLHNLLEFCSRIALLSGVAFRVVDKTLSVWKPADKGVVLSYPRDSLTGNAWERRSPEATRVFYGGQGDGAARVFRVGAVAHVRTRRREQFVDRRDVSDSAELQALASADAAARTPWVDYLTVDTTATTPSLWDGIDLGDIVTVIMPTGETVRAEVMEAMVDVTGRNARLAIGVGYRGVLGGVTEITQQVQALEAAQRARENN